ncbi:MAG: carbamoyltransferase C-terminal domain-containing protein [Nanoarchaeota archaeon]
MSTYILGLQPASTHFSSHDPSACLIKDGKIVAFAEEERFVRIKHAKGIFPLHAIRYCLQHAGIGLADVDKIALPADPAFCAVSPEKLLRFEKTHLAGNLVRTVHSLRMMKVKGFKQAPAIEKEIKEEVKGLLKPLTAVKDDVFVFVQHHLAHAASAYYCSPFKKASVLTIDGVGEIGQGECSVLWTGDGKDLVKNKAYLYPNSLGHYYSLVCNHLGFEWMEGPGKVMGLAPYGAASSDFTSIFERNTKATKPYDVTKMMSRLQVRALLGKARKAGEELTERHKNIAFMLQLRLEEMALSLAEENRDITGSENLCLAGGVAMNCVMNGRLLRSSFVKDIFVQPGATDLGLSIGAAIMANKELGNDPFVEFSHVYLGPSFTNEEIKQAFAEAGLKQGMHYDQVGDITGTTADLMAKNRLIAWFQGRMEGGPRALGGRSIVANPRDKAMKDIINAKVKHRELWRPFCPSLLERANEEYIEDAYPSPYMILAFNVKKEKQAEIPSVVHVDGSARTQTVTKETNAPYFKLISEFEKLTGTPVIMNTSLNDRGEPIVCSPKDAVKTFLNTGLEYLAIGDFLVKKV